MKSDAKQEDAHRKVIDLVLRYDLMEDRAIKWRRQNNIAYNFTVKQRINDKYYFVYGDWFNPKFTESIFTLSYISGGIKKKIKNLLIQYPQLKCYGNSLICCGAHHENLVYNKSDEILFCSICSHDFKVSSFEKDVINRSIGLSRIKRVRSCAVIIWESR